MAEAARPAVFTIPPHRAFADALAAGLLQRSRGDPLALARGLVLLPNNRAVRALTDAFVRRAETGLLLPRLVAIGDEELDERLGAALDPAEEGGEVTPAVEPMLRRMMLARAIARHRRALGQDIGAPEAVRLAADLARTLDQLLVEEVAPSQLAQAVDGELSAHWEATLDLLRILLGEWPDSLAALGRLDPPARRSRLLDRVARRWRGSPPDGFVVAAGITTSAPAVARLLRTVSRLPEGMVVLPALDLDLPDEQWRALGPHVAEQEGVRPRPSVETHPQFHLKLLLDRMGVARGEVERWRFGGGHDAPAVRARVIGHAMAPAEFTTEWAELPDVERRLTGVRALELATPAEEAQTIALALREALETAARTAALVTPDRGLAARVAAHLGRWGVAIDDSAGRPLAVTPAGTLLLAIAEAAAERFAPVALLALVKHPLVRRGDARLDWLAGARTLDRALRGPRPAPGLAGIAAHLTGGGERERAIRQRAAAWWEAAAPPFAALERAFADPSGDLPAWLAAVREAATALAGDDAWARPDGRAAAEMVAALEEAAAGGPEVVRPDEVALILSHCMADVAVRPPQGGHPRLAIYGLLEARLQQPDLVILGGLNEGVWPALPAPDPWLAPRIRASLGLPGLERRIGLAAHDFASALGAPRVLVTRARRDARAPTVASRFWLRLEALTGGMTRDDRLAALARRIDAPAAVAPAPRPAPSPPREARPSGISVTAVDRLKADPFAFYAASILRLPRWDAVDAPPSPAWRGTAVHAVLEAWLKDDACDPAALERRVAAMLAASDSHPLMRALWAPRLAEAIEWVAAKVAASRAEGRVPLAAEIKGSAEIAGVTLRGTADRIDRLEDGSLAIVDYKTGQAPRAAQVRGGFSMQLGLIGLIAERGGFSGIAGMPLTFEYWSLARGPKGGLGHVSSPVGGKGDDRIAPEEFTGYAARIFEAAAGKWLTGGEPFVAKLHPELAPYDEYDQLMRLDEWYGRE